MANFGFLNKIDMFDLTEIKMGGPSVSFLMLSDLINITKLTNMLFFRSNVV